MINLIFKLFGGTIRTHVATAITAAALWIVAQAATHLSPQVAATIDPNALAATMLAIVLWLMNVLTNKTHNANLEALQNAIETTVVSIPVKQAIAVEASKTIVQIPNKSQGGLGPIKIVIATLFLSITAANAQITVVQHKEFKTWFDAGKNEPIYVKWTLTPAMLPKDHLPRINKFCEDPQIPGTKLNRDYEESGYDQGHQMPAQDAASDQQAETECFYFSNMEPQVPELNRVTWKDLEMWCRHEVTTTGHTLTIVCGGGNFTGSIGPDKVAIPSYCWKAIEENGKWTAYLFPNVATVKNKPFTEYAINIKDLDAKLGTSVEKIQ